MASSLTSSQLILNNVTLTSGSSGTILTDNDVSPLLTGVDWYYLGSTYNQWTYAQGGVSVTRSATSTAANITLSSISVGAYGTFNYYTSGTTYRYIYLPSSGTYIYSLTNGSGLGTSIYVTPSLTNVITSGGTSIGYVRHASSDSATEDPYYQAIGWYYRIS